MQIEDSQEDPQLPGESKGDSSVATSAPPALLEMRDVSLRRERRDARLRRVNFKIRSGEIVLVRRPRGETRQLLCSAALGLITPKRGQVMVNGVCWRETAYLDRLTMRSRMGRVFDTGGWLLNLTVFDNMLLTEQHHRNETDVVLTERVHEMLAEIGISLPRQTPAHVEPWKLRICQWVRALLGNPDLLVMERPLKGIPGKYRQPLFEAERRFRENGGGTLWVTDQESVMNNSAIKNAVRLEAKDQYLVPYQSRAGS